MKKGQKSVTNGIENVLCPFTDQYITQGAGEGNHQGILAVDVRGLQSGVRYPYYAPCTVKCLKTYPESGQVMWQSTGKVRCSNNYIGIITFMTVHDDTMDAKPGLVVPQGNQLGNLGTKGRATGVHCHIEFSQGADTSWFKNKYGVYMFNNEKDIDDVCFYDDTNCMNRTEYLNRRYTNSIKPQPSGKNYVNLPPSVNSWKFYDLNVAPVKANAKGTLNPQKFGGLSYYVYAYHDNGTTAEIQTQQFGRVKIYIKDTPATITYDSWKYEAGNH